MPRQFGTTGVQSYTSAPAVGPAGSTYYDSLLKLHFLSDGTRWIVASSDYVASRGPGLVTNGSALLGTNYNWNNSYDLVKSDHPVGAAGSFQPRGSNPQSTACDELLPIDPAGSWDMTFAYRQVAGDGSRIFYSYLVPYDADKLQIGPQHYMEQANTRTTLALPLNPGDPTITLASAANWENVLAAPTYDYMRSMIIWAYTDGQGFTWPVGTYSRLWYSGLWNPSGISGNVITLKTPWAGSAYPAGTVVGNGASGGNFMYGASSLLAPSAWTNYSYRYSGVHTDLTKSAGRSFPAGTSYVQVGFLHNYSTNDPTAISRIANINLVQVTAAAKQGLPAAGTAGQVLVKNTATDYDAGWSNPAGPSGAAGGSLAGSYPNPTLGPGVVADANVAAAAAIAQSKVAGLAASLAAKQDAGATAGGDLSGTYPNPQIAAGTIVDADISAGAAIAQSKVAGLVAALTVADTGWLDMTGWAGGWVAAGGAGGAKMWQARQIGNVVYLRGNVKADTFTGTNITVCSLPGGITPPSQSSGFLITGAAVLRWGNVLSTGAVQVTSGTASAGSWLQIVGYYLTN